MAGRRNAGDVGSTGSNAGDDGPTGSTLDRWLSTRRTTSITEGPWKCVTATGFPVWLENGLSQGHWTIDYAREVDLWVRDGFRYIGNEMSKIDQLERLFSRIGGRSTIDYQSFTSQLFMSLKDRVAPYVPEPISKYIGVFTEKELRVQYGKWLEKMNNTPPNQFHAEFDRPRWILDSVLEQCLFESRGQLARTSSQYHKFVYEGLLWPYQAKRAWSFEIEYRQDNVRGSLIRLYKKFFDLCRANLDGAMPGDTPIKLLQMVLIEEVKELPGLSNWSANYETSCCTYLRKDCMPPLIASMIDSKGWRNTVSHPNALMFNKLKRFFNTVRDELVGVDELMMELFNTRELVLFTRADYRQMAGWAALITPMTITDLGDFIDSTEAARQTHSCFVPEPLREYAARWNMDDDQVVAMCYTADAVFKAGCTTMDAFSGGLIWTRNYLLYFCAAFNAVERNSQNVLHINTALSNEQAQKTMLWLMVMRLCSFYYQWDRLTDAQRLARIDYEYRTNLNWYEREISFTNYDNWHRSLSYPVKVSGQGTNGVRWRNLIEHHSLWDYRRIDAPATVTAFVEEFMEQALNGHGITWRDYRASANAPIVIPESSSVLGSSSDGTIMISDTLPTITAADRSAGYEFGRMVARAAIQAMGSERLRNSIRSAVERAEQARAQPPVGAIVEPNHDSPVVRALDLLRARISDLNWDSSRFDELRSQVIEAEHALFSVAPQRGEISEQLQILYNAQVRAMAQVSNDRLLAFYRHRINILSVTDALSEARTTDQSESMSMISEPETVESGNRLSVTTDDDSEASVDVEALGVDSDIPDQLYTEWHRLLAKCLESRHRTVQEELALQGDILRIERQIRDLVDVREAPLMQMMAAEYFSRAIRTPPEHYRTNLFLRVRGGLAREQLATPERRMAINCWMEALDKYAVNSDVPETWQHLCELRAAEEALILATPFGSLIDMWRFIILSYQYKLSVQRMSTVNKHMAILLFRASVVQNGQILEDDRRPFPYERMFDLDATRRRLDEYLRAFENRSTWCQSATDEAWGRVCNQFTNINEQITSLLLGAPADKYCECYAMIEELCDRTLRALPNTDLGTKAYRRLYPVYQDAIRIRTYIRVSGSAIAPRPEEAMVEDVRVQTVTNVSSSLPDVLNSDQERAWRAAIDELVRLGTLEEQQTHTTDRLLVSSNAILAAMLDIGMKEIEYLRVGAEQHQLFILMSVAYQEALDTARVRNMSTQIVTFFEDRVNEMDQRAPAHLREMRDNVMEHLRDGQVDPRDRSEAAAVVRELNEQLHAIEDPVIIHVGNEMIDSLNDDLADVEEGAVPIACDQEWINRREERLISTGSLSSVSDFFRQDRYHLNLSVYIHNLDNLSTDIDTCVRRRAVRGRNDLIRQYQMNRSKRVEECTGMKDTYSIFTTLGVPAVLTEGFYSGGVGFKLNDKVKNGFKISEKVWFPTYQSSTKKILINQSSLINAFVMCAGDDLISFARLIVQSANICMTYVGHGETGIKANDNELLFVCNWPAAESLKSAAPIRTLGGGAGTLNVSPFAAVVLPPNSEVEATRQRGVFFVKFAQLPLWNQPFDVSTVISHVPCHYNEWYKWAALRLDAFLSGDFENPSLENLKPAPTARAYTAIDHTRHQWGLLAAAVQKAYELDPSWGRIRWSGVQSCLYGVEMTDADSIVAAVGTSKATALQAPPQHCFTGFNTCINCVAKTPNETCTICLEENVPCIPYCESNVKHFVCLPCGRRAVHKCVEATCGSGRTYHCSIGLTSSQKKQLVCPVCRADSQYVC